jgi:uncharacterized protein YicC (UPF0701 family)
MKAPRQEPKFEGDRNARNLGQLARDLDEEYPRPANRASDYAPRDVRDSVANIEADIAQLAAQEAIPVLERARDIGNSTDMQKAKAMVNNTVTAAHTDTCKALDKVVAEIRGLAERAARDVDEYKKALQSGGQEVAVMLEATMQTITRTVEWIEKATPALRNPKLEPPIENKLDAAGENAAGGAPRS